MPKKRKETSPAVPVPGAVNIQLDLGALYDLSRAGPHVDVVHSAYSNLGLINVMERDVFIDFIQVPPRPSGGSQVAPTTRIYMSHAAALKLADALQDIIGGAASAGRLEQVTTKAKRGRPSPK